MATISELVVKVIADTTGLDSGLKSAQTSIKGVGTEAQNADGKTSGLSSAFSSLKGALVAGGAIAAVTTAAKVIADSVKAFGEAEIAAKRLDSVSTMRGWVDGADRIGDLADELQRLTGVDGDYIKQLGAELLAQGKSLDQTEDLITAAAQLSSITGDDLGTSVKQLTNTYSGMAGSIGRSIPEIKALSEEELRNGEAVDIILEKYGAFAEQLTDTVSVATDRASESMGDLKETLGQAFAPVTVSLANDFTNAVNKMLPTLTYMATHSFDRAFVELWEAITGTKGAVTQWEEAVAEASRAEASYNAGLRALQTELDTVTEKTKTMSDAELAAARAFLYAQMQRSTSMAQLTQAQKTLDAFDSEIAALRKKEADEIAVAKKAAAKEAADEAVKQAKREEEERKKRTKDTIDYCIAQEDERAKAVADAYGDTIVASAEAENERVEKAEEASKRLEEAFTTAIQATSSAFEALGEDLVNGGDLWGSFAKAAIASVAGIVKALGDELAAKAAARLIEAIAATASVVLAPTAPGLYASAGLLAGGAAAAWTASGALNAYAGTFARGTDYSPAGMAWINEEGPELVNLPAGTSITPATETPVGSAKSGGNTFIFNSPVALTPSQEEARYKKTVRDLSFQGVL